MKRIALLTLLLPLVSLISPVSAAEAVSQNVIYKGVVTTKFTSQRGVYKERGILFLVVDSLAEAGVSFRCTTDDFGLRVYQRLPFNLLFLRVGDERGTTYTVFTNAGSFDADGGITLGASLLSGKNAPISIGQNRKIRLPRVLQGTENVVFAAYQNGTSTLLEQTQLLALHSSLTTASNDSNGGIGESLESAANRIARWLQQRGFTETAP